MSIVIVDITERRNRANMVILRLHLSRPRIYRLPKASCILRGISGVAWLTFDIEDKFVWAGKSIRVESNRNGAIVSALGDEPLVIEIENQDSISYDCLLEGFSRVSTAPRRGRWWLPNSIWPN